MSWSVELNGKSISVGEMRINKFDEIAAAAIIDTQFQEAGSSLRSTILLL